MQDSKEFWEKKYKSFTPYHINMNREIYNFLKCFDDLNGKRVLEIGCGNGDISIYLAKKGAIVTAIDNTSNSIQNAKCMAEYNNVSIQFIKMDALEINTLKEKYDIVVGRFVLHHIEPFNQFVKKLHCIMSGNTKNEFNGIGLFYENSSSNKLLMFFRKYLVGKFGILKDSDEVEVPFERKEIRMLERQFQTVNVTYPKMVFFRMLGSKIFGNKPRMKHFCTRIDKICYKYLSFLNRWSYHQVIYFEK